MELLGTYELTGHLTSQNSGYSIWGFGKKNGQDYFLKQFLSPRYPENDPMSSPERIARKKRQCQRFEQKKAALYEKINENSDGNAVRVEEFFRIESKYYISMQKIEDLKWTVGDVAALPREQVVFLCAVIAHGIAGIHKGSVVHADLKHDNVLFMKSNTGEVTAKIIDFDSGFLETDPPKDGEEIVGDQVYFSPEACATFLGRNPELTCKMDVFALGILFHQYLTGALPGYDTNLGTCAGEAVAKGGTVTVSDALEEDLRALLERMLSPNPHARPTAFEVYSQLMDRLPKPVVEEAPPAVEEKPPVVQEEPPKSSGNPFFRPGDL